MVAIFGGLTSESFSEKNPIAFNQIVGFVVNFPVIFFNMVLLSPSSLVLCL